MRSWVGKAVLVAALAVVALVAVVAWQLQPPPGPSPDAESFSLVDVTVIVPTVERRTGADLHVDGGTVVERGAGDGAVLDDLRGSFVLPGLVDMHGHMPPGTPLRLTRYFGLLYALHGVTTVRDAGDVDGTSLPAVRRELGPGGEVGPRVLAAGPFVSRGEPVWKNSLLVDTVEDAERAVQELHAAGVDCIKAYDGLTAEQIRAIVRTADALDLPVLGHVPVELTYEEALMPDTQHLRGVVTSADDMRSRFAAWAAVDDDRLATVVGATVAHDLAHTPTLVSHAALLGYRDRAATLDSPAMRWMPRMFRDVVWHPEEGIPAWRGLTSEDLDRVASALRRKVDLVGRLHAAGARLHLGTDVPQPFVVPGASLWQEMELFARAGVPLPKIWAMATWRSGEELRVQGLGRLEVGAPADLLVFSEDPTESLQALGSLRAVVVGGRLFRVEGLRSAAEAYQRHFDGWLVDRLSVTLTRRLLKQSAGETDDAP